MQTGASDYERPAYPDFFLVWTYRGILSGLQVDTLRLRTDPHMVRVPKMRHARFLKD